MRGEATRSGDLTGVGTVGAAHSDISTGIWRLNEADDSGRQPQVPRCSVVTEDVVAATERIPLEPEPGCGAAPFISITFSA